MPPGSGRRLLTIGGLALLAAGAVVVGLRSTRYQPEAVRPALAVGDSVCLSCHMEQESYRGTAHRLTSRLPTPDAMRGSFRDGENIVRTSNPALYFRLDSTATGYHQTAITGRPPDTTVRTERIAYVVGTRRGQSYLYWRDDRLYQLPISYWRGIGWANSPAYPEGRAHFERAIPPRCLECHATAAEPVSDPVAANRYRRDGIVLGIGCETCHGAGHEHVRRERSALRAVLPSAIVNPARLPRARQLDGCALCHGGTAPLRTEPFTYVPGEPLERRFDLYARADTGRLDVHGNQVALLERSRCFVASAMTCATCHDVHRVERDVASLSERCLDCHTVQRCGLFPRHGQTLEGRCVDCHMPALTSGTVVAGDPDRPARVELRTHWIKVYPQYQSP